MIDHGPHRPPIAAWRQGFTLIELLVVVAILALLIGILLPSLSNARKQARAVACRCNLRQIATGFFLYASDNNQCLPPSADYQPGSTLPDGSSSSDPRIGSGNHWYDYLSNTKALPNGTRLLSSGSPDPKYLGFDLGVWHCPEVTDAQMLKNGSYGWGGGYGVNESSVAKIFGYATLKTGPGPGSKRLIDIRSVGTRWLVGDTGRPSAPQKYYAWCGTNEPNVSNGFFDRSGAITASASNQPGCYHNGDTANVSFFDGHVEGVSYNDLKADKNDLFGVNSL